MPLVGFGAQTDEFVEAGGGAEDDADDYAPRGDAEPFVDEPAGRAEGHDGGEEGDAGGVGKAGFAVLALVVFVGQVTSFRVSGSFWERRRAGRDANGASSRE